MDLKKKFGITELKTEHAYNKHLEPQLKAEQMDVDAMGCKLYKMCLGYSTWLNETKLTPELVEKLFKGMKKADEWDRVGFSNGSVTFLFSSKILVKVKKIGWNRVETLADLARLTAAKPILLA